jgi:hypothetical protein
VSGCGDAYAAGVGVSIANVTNAGLVDVMTLAFSGAISLSQTVGDAAAVAHGVAIAFASEMGCEQSHSCKCCTCSAPIQYFVQQHLEPPLASNLECVTFLQQTTWPCAGQHRVLPA